MLQKSDLINYFYSSFTDKEHKGIGTEHEKFIFHCKDKKRIEFDGQFPSAGKLWPFSRRGIFANRRADPTADLSQTFAGDPAGANGASNGGIRAEIRTSLGFLGCLSFSLRLPSMRPGG